MIATDKQYRVTQERIGTFRTALAAAESDTAGPVHVRELYLRSLRSQIEDLEREILEYDELRTGTVTEFDVADLADLPTALIKARIARKLSQTDLADLVGVPPQQIQRWEADGYSRAGLDKLKKIASALRVRISQRVVFEGTAPIAVDDLRRKVAGLGLPIEVFDGVMVPITVNDDIQVIDEIDERMERLLGFGAALATQDATGFRQSVMRFKLPASAEQERTRAYAAYVDGVCSIVGKTIGREAAALPQDWRKMRELLFPDGILKLHAAIRKCWDLGIGVITLDDPVAFHGSCWRREARTVVVLKQPFLDPARWLFDLLHELYHAAVAPEGDDFIVVEADETSPERRDSQEEKRASRFAALIMLNGRVKELTDLVSERAGNHVERMKRATVDVASEMGVPPGVLANQMAHRLAASGHNWWGTAAGLQQREGDPRETVRLVFAERANLAGLDRVERSIVAQSMGV